MRRNPGSAGGLWFVRIFILPHTLVGFGAIIYLLFLSLWALVGTDIPGVVTDTEITHSSKGNTYHTLKYQYQIGGQTKSGSGNVSATVYERFQVRDVPRPPVTVRYFALGPLEHAKLHESGRLWGEVGMLLLWAAFWNGILSVFLYEVWIKPIRRRLLYRHGHPTDGTVLGKRTKPGKTPRYYITYSFLHPDTGDLRNAETEVLVADYDRAKINQPVTVLYAPGHPQRSTLYEFGGYHVRDVAVV